MISEICICFFLTLILRGKKVSQISRKKFSQRNENSEIEFIDVFLTQIFVSLATLMVLHICVLLWCVSTGHFNLELKDSLDSFREKDLTATCIIKMEGNKTSITNLKVRLVVFPAHADCHSSSNWGTFFLISKDSREHRRWFTEGSSENFHVRLLLRLHGLQKPHLRLPGEGK